MKSNRKILILIVSLFVVIATYVECVSKNALKKTEATVTATASN